MGRSKANLSLVSTTRNIREQLHARILSEYVADERILAKFRDKTVSAKVRVIESLILWSGLYVWEWSPEIIRQWLTEPVQAKWSKNYLRLQIGRLKDFNDYAADPASKWPDIIRKTFDVQIRQNVSLRRYPKHGHDGLSNKRRPWTEDEVEKLLNHLLQRMIESQKNGRRGGFAAARDYAMFVTQLAYGLRAQELCYLEFCDILESPDAEPTQIFGEIGALNIRFPKSFRGEEPKPGVVVSVPLFVSHVDTLRWYLTHIRPMFSPKPAPANTIGPKQLERYNPNKIFLSDVGTRMEPGYWSDRLREHIREVGLDPDLVSHDCRHYYATRVQENGYDFVFVREQLRHAHASSTSIYTWIDDSFRRKRVKAAAQEELKRRKT